MESLHKLHCTSYLPASQCNIRVRSECATMHFNPIPCGRVLPRPPLPHTHTLQGPSTAPAGPSLLKFGLKTRKSILNKVTKFQIPTPNRLGARIEKPAGAEAAPPPQGIGRVKVGRQHWYTRITELTTNPFLIPKCGSVPAAPGTSTSRGDFNSAETLAPN